MTQIWVDGQVGWIGEVLVASEYDQNTKCILQHSQRTNKFLKYVYIYSEINIYIYTHTYTYEVA